MTQLEESPALPGIVTRTSYELPPNITIEEWMDIGEILRGIAYSVQFWVGDWLAFGENNFGDNAFQALNRRDKTLANWASTCRQVAPSRRREDVDFSHHVEVAKLEPAAQERVLERVAEDNLTVRQTRELVEEEERLELEKQGFVFEEGKVTTCPRCNGEGRIVRRR